MLRTIGLVSLTVLFGACANTRHGEPPPPRAEQAESMQVVPLQFAMAGELERELTQALGGSKRSRPKIVADARTNSLIVVAEDKDDLSRALELIARLDVQAPIGR